MTTTTDTPRRRPKRKKTGVERVVYLIGVVGRAFVVGGPLLLFFTAYLLWGTGVYTRHQQGVGRTALAKQSIVPEDVLAKGGKIPPGRPKTQPKLGDPLFALKIQKIALDTVVG